MIFFGEIPDRVPGGIPDELLKRISKESLKEILGEVPKEISGGTSIVILLECLHEYLVSFLDKFVPESLNKSGENLDISLEE